MSLQYVKDIVRYLLAGLLGVGIGYMFFLGVKSFVSPCTVYIEYGPAAFDTREEEMANDDREVYDTGMENTIVVLSLHLYDDYEELNLDYQTYVYDPVDEVWGWSDCEWQQEQNAAFCDIYTVRPEFVRGDAMDTLGHEVWHAVAGDFHE